jgi:hypothetical protein
MHALPRQLKNAAAGFALYAAAVGALFALAGSVPPDPSGAGTHVALGLPPCPLLAATGIPCPACGMTTAFAHAARGQILSAFAAQPFGAALALGSLAGLAVVPAALARGVTVSALLSSERTSRVARALLGLLLLAWAYKVGATLLLA